MRVLMVLCDMHAGGAEKTALELIRALRGRGFSFTAAAVKGGGVLAGAFAEAGAEVIDGVAKCRFDPLAPVRIAGIIRRRGIEAVIIVDVARNAMFHGLWGAALSRTRPVRICWCKSPLGGLAGRFTGRLRRYRAFCGLDAIVCTSRLQRRMLVQRGLARRRIALIRNGVDLSRLAETPPSALELPAGKKIVVQVANAMPDKDHATLIAAAGALARTRDDFHLVLLGRGTDGPAMRRAASSAGVAGKVSLLGYRDDVPGILGAADVFVLSTRSEAFSVAALEAMAAKLPVVVSDIPAFDEMFVHGREGLKVPPGDPAALASAVGCLLDDDELRARLGAAARLRAERFSAARMAGAFERLLPAARQAR